MSMYGWVLNPADSDVLSDLPMCSDDIHSLLSIHQQVASALETLTLILYILLSVKEEALKGWIKIL